MLLSLFVVHYITRSVLKVIGNVVLDQDVVTDPCCSRYCSVDQCSLYNQTEGHKLSSLTFLIDDFTPLSMYMYEIAKLNHTYISSMTLITKIETKKGRSKVELETHI